MILPMIPFRFERQMLAPLAAGLPQLLSLPETQLVRVLREPAMGMIIPDLLVGSWATAAPPRSYAGATLLDAHVRALLEREGPRTPDEIMARLYLSSTAGNAAISRLRRHKIVVEESTPSDAVTPAMTPRLILASAASSTCLEIVALETKLTRWSEAVAQAQSYLTFAERSFVVLDGNRVAETPAILAACQEAGVGLVFQHAQVLRTSIEAPRHPAPITPVRMIALTKLATERGGRAFRRFVPRQPHAASLQ